MQSGELIVTGKDEAKIKLERCPSKIKVHFIGAPLVIPCNQPHTDSVQWELQRNFHKHHGGYILVIKWHVSDVREIKWTVLY